MAIGITLTFGTNSVRLERFSGGGAQRSYVDSATLNFGATGSAIQSGFTRSVRRLWTVSTLATKEQTFALQTLYEAWDTLRATGAVAIVQLRDEVTVADPAAPLLKSTVFSEPLSVELVGNGSPLYRVTFGLSEV